MATHAATEDEEHDRSQCWCCGTTEDPARMVHLGNHPEVALCVRCARWASHQARDIEDVDKTGPGVFVRDRLRGARRVVMDRGWHHSRIFGGPIRWLGKHVP